jgi:hypothetical protein
MLLMVTMDKVLWRQKSVDKKSVNRIIESVMSKLELQALEKKATSKGVYLELYVSRGYIMIGYIKREKNTPKGLGAEVLNEIKELATSKQMPIGLDVDAGIIDRSVQDRLINYYRQHGFTFNSAEFRRDPDLDVFMTSGRERKPMMYWNPEPQR